MSNKLISIVNTSGSRESTLLDIDAHLSKTRQALKSKQYMTSEDAFIYEGGNVSKSDEKSILLSTLVGSDGSKKLNIGNTNPGGLTPGTAYQTYQGLTASQKLSLLQNIQIFHGLTISKGQGLHRSFKQILTPWHPNNSDLPDYARPTYVSEVKVSSSFSKEVNSFKESNVNSASLSLTTPYGDAHASYQNAKTHSGNSEKVTTYMLGQMFVNKIKLSIDKNKLHAIPQFETDIKNIIDKQDEGDLDKCAALVDYLNKYGYYVAQEVTLGGLIMSSDTTKISKFSESSSEKTDFSVGFKLEMDGFGAGGDYSNSKGHDKSHSSETTYTNLSIRTKGGNDSQKYKAWSKSLNSAILWDVISYDKLYPTLALIKSPRIQHACFRLLQNNCSVRAIVQKQNIIDLNQYVSQTLLVTTN